jgi:hypothetical protein
MSYSVQDSLHQIIVSGEDHENYTSFTSTFHEKILTAHIVDLVVILVFCIQETNYFLEFRKFRKWAYYLHMVICENAIEKIQIYTLKTMNKVAIHVWSFITFQTKVSLPDA